MHHPFEPHGLMSLQGRELIFAQSGMLGSLSLAGTFPSIPPAPCVGAGADTHGT